jgi:hypothetical protein
MRLPPLPLLALLLLGAGCSREETVAVRDSPYYPLKVGCRWVYKGTGPVQKGAKDPPRLVRKVIAHEKVGGYPCAVIANLRGNDTPRKEHVYATAEGVYLVAIEGRRLSSPLRILKLPPKAGEHWRSDLKDKASLRKGVYVMGEEEVTVPAGTYKAVTLRGEISEPGDRTTDVKYWFAEGVGMVKQLVRTAAHTAVYELERFEMP